MVLLTSSMIPRGVDAPAVIPTVTQPAKLSGLSSSARSMSVQRLQTEEAISNSFFVFELSLPPITIIPSLIAARPFVSLCLFSVTLHIVSKIIAFVYSFFNFFSHFFQRIVFCVVWATKTMGFSGCFSAASSFSSSASLSNTTVSPFA